MADEPESGNGIANLGLIFTAILAIVVGIWVFGGFAGEPSATFRVEQPIEPQPKSPPTTP